VRVPPSRTPWSTNKIDGIKVRTASVHGAHRWSGFHEGLRAIRSHRISNGADGKPDTKDDLELGPVDVAWNIDEYTATFDDDDKSFVGTLERQRILYLPMCDGPNPKRQGNGNNVGDVWVVGNVETRRRQSDPGRVQHLLVTRAAPIVKFDQPEVAQ